MEDIYIYIYFKKNLLTEKKGKVKDARKRGPERRWNRSLSTDGRINLQERQGCPSAEAEQEDHKLTSNTNKIQTVRSVYPGVSEERALTFL